MFTDNLLFLFTYSILLLSIPRRGLLIIQLLTTPEKSTAPSGYKRKLCASESNIHSAWRYKEAVKVGSRTRYEKRQHHCHMDHKQTRYAPFLFFFVMRCITSQEKHTHFCFWWGHCGPSILVVLPCCLRDSVSIGSKVFHCVPNNKSTLEIVSGVFFLQLAREELLSTAGKKRIPRDNLVVRDKSPSTVVCSRHSKPGDTQRDIA